MKFYKQKVGSEWKLLVCPIKDISNIQKKKRIGAVPVSSDAEVYCCQEKENAGVVDEYVIQNQLNKDDL